MRIAAPDPRLRGALSAAVLVAVLAGVVAWIVLSSRGFDSAPAAATDRVVAVGGASITVPADWAPARATEIGRAHV